MLQFCQLNYGVTFPIAKKGDVNGPETQPIWKYLKENAEEPVKDIDWVSLTPVSHLISSRTDGNIQNFSKFLIKNGKIKWFPARTTKVVSPCGRSPSSSYVR